MAQGNIKGKDGAADLKKEPLEIKCSACGAHFRLWIPASVLPEWESGSQFSCIKCGRKYLIRKDKGRFVLMPVKEAPPVQPVAPLPEKRPVAVQPRPAPLRPAPPQHLADLPHAAPVEPRERQRPPQPAEQYAVRPEPFQQPSARFAAANEHAAESDVLQAGARHTVLLVEDDRLASEMIEKALKGSGIRLIVAKNSGEALRALKSTEIGLIVTDMYLKNLNDPEAQLDGEELLMAVSSMGLEIPAVMTTGKDIVDDLVLDPKWFDLHVKGFIQKGNPFWVDELRMKIKELAG